MDYVTFLSWPEDEPTMFTVGGGLSGAPISADEIESEFYGLPKPP